jgi:hypothetical protein
VNNDKPTTDAEWRNLILEEIRDSRGELRSLRDDFQNFRGTVLSEQGEARGKSKVWAAVISFSVSIVVALIHTFGFLKAK